MHQAPITSGNSNKSLSEYAKNVPPQHLLKKLLKDNKSWEKAIVRQSMLTYQQRK